LRNVIYVDKKAFILELYEEYKLIISHSWHNPAVYMSVYISHTSCIRSNSLGKMNFAGEALHLKNKWRKFFSKMTAHGRIFSYLNETFLFINICQYACLVHATKSISSWKATDEVIHTYEDFFFLLHPIFGLIYVSSAPLVLCFG
jgi:hypothetical protein